jgi:hypothetical protein
MIAWGKEEYEASEPFEVNLIQGRRLENNRALVDLFPIRNKVKAAKAGGPSASPVTQLVADVSQRTLLYQTVPFNSNRMSQVTDLKIYEIFRTGHRSPAMYEF